MQQVIVGLVVVAALAWVLRPTIRRILRRRQLAAGKAPGPCGNDSCNCGG